MGVALRKPLDVAFVQDAGRQRDRWRLVVVPVKLVMDHACLEGQVGIVVGFEVAWVLTVRGKVRVAPDELAHNLAGIRVQEQF